jgi:hypothetical protein
MTKISQLTNIGSALAADDEFVVRDVSDVSTPNKKVTSSGIIDYIISQGGVSGFSQIAAGVGPLSRVQATSSGATGTIAFSTASATTLLERARVDSAGRVLVGTTTANTSGAKLQTSDGLTFPATAVASADPNTLDDYEEGTWTGVDGSGAGLSITVNNAKYTKIGRLVYVSASTITYPVTASAVSASIGGLPFTNAAADVALGALVSTATGASRALLAGNSTIALFYPNTGATTSMNSALSGATIYGFSIVYQV